MTLAEAMTVSAATTLVEEMTVPEAMAHLHAKHSLLPPRLQWR
jgi:hypothetical protein